MCQISLCIVQKSCIGINDIGKCANVIHFTELHFNPVKSFIGLYLTRQFRYEHGYTDNGMNLREGALHSKNSTHTP